MIASKFFKLAAHLMCGTTYFTMALGFHAEFLYVVPGIAYMILMLAEVNQ